MSPHRWNNEGIPERLYVITGGRSRPDSDVFDLVSLVVSECDPSPGMQPEHASILRMCREPMAVAEVSAHLRLPVSIVKILLADLLNNRQIVLRSPRTADRSGTPDIRILEEVLVGLRNL